METIILEGCGVHYSLHARSERSIKARVLRPGRWRKKTEFWALRHVTLTVRSGEVLGVIGRNGAGKSTLMLLLAGLLYPDEGTVEVRGRISTLLGLGAGFVPELTGRDNIRLSASFLGMPRKRIEALADRIIEFADLGEFVDEPVRNYSSGMQARLGFSIAAQVEPDILLIDEVLGVGDARFKAKSSERIHELIAAAKTIVVVTHSMEFVREHCTAAVWLEKGEVAACGQAEEVVNAYMSKA
jgi:teichoic acid transport system ATP-binding protein